MKVLDRYERKSREVSGPMDLVDLHNLGSHIVFVKVSPHQGRASFIFDGEKMGQQL